MKITVAQRLVEQVNISNIFTPVVAFAFGIGTIVGPVFEYFYGLNRWHILAPLFLMIFMDWIAGIRAAKKDNTYASEYGIDGVFRTLFVISFPALANLLDVAFSTPGLLFYGFTFGLYYHVFNSMTANAYRAGWGRWIPQKAVNLVKSEIAAKAKRAEKRKI